MQLAILLFDGITALDAVGPYEVLARAPDIDVRFVAKAPGPVRSANRSSLPIVAESSLSDVPGPDILLVPGGPGQTDVRRDEEILDWIRAVHAVTRWTASVCTGSLILGAAGLLRGVRATSHWLALEDLREFGANPTAERVVISGKIMTSAGVSAGIDMALTLFALVWGDESAQLIQLGLEYDPQPPFDTGHPSRAPARLVDRIRIARSVQKG